GTPTCGGGGGACFGGGACCGVGDGAATGGISTLIAGSGCGGISGGFGIDCPTSAIRGFPLDPATEAHFPWVPGQKAVTEGLTNRTIERWYWPRSREGSPP